MNKTEDILEKLKAAEQPAIDNPDALTDLIMSNLPKQNAPQKEQPKKPYAMLIALRVISTIAALYLVGLFFYLQQEPVAKVETAYNNNMVEEPQPASQPAYCTEGTPREILMCYMERREAQPHIYQQLKQKSYENQ
ncbi:MAG: hypothetical protein J5502_01775 [Prevotella sp.]|nr:hypothetical protein [Prevotella sp.]